MATKRIEIIYDINGKAIDVAVDSTLNLKKQVVELTKALRSAKEGSDEFRILSTRLSDVKDELGKTTAKSKDLFGSLSMLPGPVGQFFGQLQSGIDLLKTFSSFTFKDLAFQFKETADDIADIGKNITNIDGKKIDGLTNSSNGLNESLKNTASTAGSLTNAVKSSQEQWVNYDKSVGDLYKNTGALITQYPKMINGVEVMTDAVRMNNGSIRDLSQSELIAINSGKSLTLTTEGLIVAEKQATFWTSTLGATIKSVLIASGIGVAIVLIGELVSYLYKMATGEEAAAEATAKLNKELENQNLLLSLDTKSLKRRNAETIALMKAQGKSESEIRTATLKNAYDEYTLAFNAEVEARKTYNANLGKVDADGLKAMEKNLTEREQATKDAYSAYIVLGYNNKAEEIKAQEQKNKELEQKNQEHLKKVAADTKTANETEITVKREIDALKITQERDRQRKELENQKLAEEDKINQLEISTKRKGEINKQIEEKYRLKLVDLNKKFDDEDAKSKQDALKKLTEIENSAISDQIQKQKADREAKYNDELNDLKKLYKDKLISEKQYQEAVINMNQALVNDLKKIDDDKKKKDQEDKLKKLDDELKFLQIRNDGITKGTMAFFDAQRELLDKTKERELAVEDLTEKQKTDIKSKYAALRKDIDKQEFAAYVGYIGAGLGVISNFYSQQQQINSLAMQNELDQVKGNAEAEDKVKEKYFYRNRDAQVGQAIISTLQSAVSAYSSLAVIPVVGPALGAAAAAAALIFGYKQVDLIKSQKYQSSLTTAGGEAAKPAMANYGKNYGDGGMIDGPRHAGGGVMINAEGGEAVMTRGAVTMFAPLLSAMNQMGGGTSFSKGAMGQANNDNPRVTQTNTPQPTIVKTYVVSSELTTEAQKQARLKDLSTL
jgi:hypothetical protein